MTGIIISGERHLLLTPTEPASKKAMEYLTLHRRCFMEKEKILRVGNCF